LVLCVLLFSLAFDIIKTQGVEDPQARPSNRNIQVRFTTLMSQEHIQNDEAVALDTKKRVKTPQLYKVLLINDDYTTMDFVVQILEIVFHKPRIEAMQVMLHVHRKGAGLCGIYPKDIAETKVAAVYELAKKNEFPLKCVMEKE
jgi:ATP-dependent Clp protease adaptor protein ClpS